MLIYDRDYCNAEITLGMDLLHFVPHRDEVMKCDKINSSKVTISTQYQRDFRWRCRKSANKST